MNANTEAVLGYAIATHPSMLLRLREFHWDSYRDFSERFPLSARESLRVVRAAQETLEAMHFEIFGNQPACLI